MSHELSILLITAASIGFIHTLFGPDHYVPFIVISKARRWSAIKTAWITLLCGIGHVGSSIVIGFIGIALGIAVFKIESVESFRGNIAGWLLIAFGLVYFVWGLRSAIRNKPHSHIHFHDGEVIHEHKHTHSEEHVHVHDSNNTVNLTPWILFTIFVFGPCEPLIPLLMYPAAQNHLFHVAIVSLVFGSITIGTMLTIVLLSSYGLSFLPMKKLERYSHSIAAYNIPLRSRNSIPGFVVHKQGIK